MPLYPLYALLFAETGLSGGEISALFAIWSAVGIVSEVPTGALADRFSRRAALVASSVLQGAGFAVWMSLPGFTSYAIGFVLWGFGGSLASGALEALLYDGLAATGDAEHYARVYGRVTAAGLLAQVPAAGAAAVLFPAGGFTLVGWISVACCLTAAGLATRLPEPPRGASDAEDDEGYLATLRAGIAEAAARPAVRAALLAVALLTALDALEEYFPLMAADWGVPTALNPLAVLAIPLVGAAGAALGGRASRAGPWRLAALVACAGLALGVAGLLARPPGLVLVVLYYGLYRLALVVVDARLQDRITGTARATVTSVAGLVTDLASLGFYAIWVPAMIQETPPWGEVVCVLSTCPRPTARAGRPRPRPRST
jgi:MFS family permease